MHEIEQAGEARERGNRGKPGGDQDRRGRAGAAAGSGVAKDQCHQSGADRLAEEPGGRLNGAGAEVVSINGPQRLRKTLAFVVFDCRRGA